MITDRKRETKKYGLQGKGGGNHESHDNEDHDAAAQDERSHENDYGEKAPYDS